MWIRTVTMSDETAQDDGGEPAGGGARRRRGPAGPTPYDRIAGLYDLWSRSVTEDVGFYVAEARKAAGAPARRRPPRARPDRRARGRHRAHRRSRSPGPACRVIGVDSSAGMLAVCRDRARGRRRRRAARPTRSATCSTRPSPSASPSSPAPSGPTCTSRATMTRLAALRAARDLLLPRRPPRLRRLHALARRHRGDARSVARARARHLRAGRLGRARAAPDALRPRRGGRARR